MADELPSMSALEAKELVFLDEKEGWIGDRGKGKGQLRQLVIGGSGQPRRDTRYAMIADGKTLRLRVRSKKASTG